MVIFVCIFYSFKENNQTFSGKYCKQNYILCQLGKRCKFVLYIFIKYSGAFFHYSSLFLTLDTFPVHTPFKIIYTFKTEEFKNVPIPPNNNKKTCLLLSHSPKGAFSW